VALEITTATLADAEELRAYVERLYAERLPGIFRRAVPTLDEERDYIRAHIEPDNSTMLVARVDGEVAGLLGFAGGESAEDAHAGTFGVSVGAGHRGRGVGSALIRELADWAPAHGIRRIQAWTWANNPGALALYERLGFEREGTCKAAIWSDGELIDAIVVARVLDAPPPA